VSLDYSTVLKINSIIIDNYTINLNTEQILNFYFYYYQSIRIGSTINFIKNVIYRDTTIYITVVYPINLSVTNIEVYLTPLILHLDNYYSIYDVDYRLNYPIIDISNNLVKYDISNNKLYDIQFNLNKVSNDGIYFIDNYIPVDISNNIINSNLTIGSWHLVLEVSIEKELFVHLVQIVYPNNLSFQSKITDINSDFYLDKIYKIKINFTNNSFIFDNSLFYSNNKLLYPNNPVSIWYKYSIITNGVPFYDNNNFYLEILNALIFINKQIYLNENDSTYYSIIIKNNKFYLVSNTYLGNNINYFYLKTDNYIKSNNPSDKTFKSGLVNHNDSRLLYTLNQSEITFEKIINQVNTVLDSNSVTFKYNIYKLDESEYTINTNNTYYIGDPFLLITQSYIYNLNTYIFTNSQIPNINNNITSLFNVYYPNYKYFSQFNLSRTIPEIMTIINQGNLIENYMVINNLKTWNSWSILSAISINDISLFLVQGDIIYTNNKISNNTNNVYFTKDKFNYLSELLIFINNNEYEYNNLLTQLNILNLISNQLIYWINDSTFWLDVQNRINNYFIELNLTVEFNGSCLIFPTDYYLGDISGALIDTSDPNNLKRKYVLNNQYLLTYPTRISRSMEGLNEQVSYLINNIDNNIFYGLEVNNLLKSLYNYGIEYKNLNTNIYVNNNKYYSYFNSLKLFINYMWNNYELSLKSLNTNFNNNETINYSLTNNYTNIINYMSNDFTIKKTNYYDSSSNEYYILDYNTFNSYYYKENISYTLVTDPLYPYKLVLSSNIIVPEVIYQINFYNVYYDSSLFNEYTYSSEIDFYLDYDLNTNIAYSLVGLTNYNISSIYQGKLYKFNLNLDYTLIDYITYKNKQVEIYKTDNVYIYLASTIDITSNNILEIYKNVGLKNQINNYLTFYQNNFNFINNHTYINYNNNFIPLYQDISGNYYINQNIQLNQNVLIVLLYSINTFENTNNYVYNLNLSTPFIYYNYYINNSTNIIPVNFTLNNNIYPDEIIFITDTLLYAQVTNITDISSLTHYSNIGETPPIQVLTITKQNIYLYQLNDTFNILTNSSIYISTSDYLSGILVNNNIYNKTNNIEFTTNILYSITDLKLYSCYIVSSWTVTDFIFNPTTNTFVFAYPTLLYFNNGLDYNYTIDNYLVSDIYLFDNNIITNNVLVDGTTISSFIFTQIYKSPSHIFKPELNSVLNIKLINDVQYQNNLYLLPLDKIGNTIGLYLYKIVLRDPYEPIDILTVNIINLNTYTANILIWNSDIELIVASNTVFNETNYKLEINNDILDISGFSFYQNSYQKGTFYYQTDISSFYILTSEECNNFDFSNQINYARYYIHSIISSEILYNVFNPRTINRADNMNYQITTNQTTTTIIEKPIFNLLKIFKSISLFLGDQLIETLNEDTYNIFYYLYCSEEKRNQLNKIYKIIENKNEWTVYLPLLFWFYYNSNLSIPLIALPYIDLILKYHINPLNNILSNDLTNALYSINPTINIEMVLDSILLDTNERILFGQHSHEYIIEKFVIYPENFIYKVNQTVHMDYYNLIKDIFWISKPINTNKLYNNTAYIKEEVIQDENYVYYLNIYNLFNIYNKNHTTEYLPDFSIIINNNKEILVGSNRINLINNDDLLKQYDLSYVLFYMDKYLSLQKVKQQIQSAKVYFLLLYKNTTKQILYSPITNLNIQCNGTDFVPNYDHRYYNFVIPYDKFKNSPPIGYYVYSYSLFPLDQQPSGHLNYNNFSNIVLNITSDENVLKEQYNLVTVVKEYQVLRIMSGMGSLAWIN